MPEVNEHLGHRAGSKTEKVIFDAEPTTAGTGSWLHEFQSGAFNLRRHLVQHARGTGLQGLFRLCVRSAQLAGAAPRQLTVTARLVAKSETAGMATSAGMPKAVEKMHFRHVTCAITRKGVMLNSVVSAKITYADNIECTEALRSEYRISLSIRQRCMTPLARTRSYTAARWPNHQMPRRRGYPLWAMVAPNQPAGPFFLRFRLLGRAA